MENLGNCTWESIAEFHRESFGMSVKVFIGELFGESFWESIGECFWGLLGVFQGVYWVVLGESSWESIG